MRILVPVLAFAAAWGASAAAWAALPPVYERAAEFRAIANHAGIANAFEGNPIEKIEFLSKDLYRVSAGDCHLDVAIVGKPNLDGLVGPRQFEVKPGTVVCESE